MSRPRQDVRTPRGRTWVLAALATLTLAGACGRLPGRRPTPAPTGGNPPTATAARADSAARDSARRDSVRRDTTAVAPPGTPRDTSRRAGVADPAAARRPATARRREPDPTARCGTINFNENPPTASVRSVSDGLGNYITYVGGGAVARCEGSGAILRADSAEHYEQIGQLILINNVSYAEPRRVDLTAIRMTYFTTDERLIAEGNVNVRLPSGSTMTGPNAEYLRAVARVRPASRLTAVGRPVLRVVGGARAPRSAARAQRDTSVTTMIANTLVNEADSLVFASGQVYIERTDLTANSDSATFDQGTETGRLLRNATIRGTRGRPFTLTGQTVDLYARERELSRVRASDSARVVSQDLNLRSDTVDIRMREGEVERAFAWGPSRAVATSPDRDVVADSIHAVLPGQRIRDLWAVRRAVARSAPDTARIANAADRDLLRADTIHARFDSLRTPGDTARNPPVRQIVANGNASSLYHIPAQEGRTAPPSINYVRGRLITVDFDTGQVQTVTVTEKAVGVYLQPSDSTDSTRTSPEGTAGARTPVVGDAPAAGASTGAAAPASAPSRASGAPSGASSGAPAAPAGPPPAASPTVSPTVPPPSRPQSTPPERRPFDD